MKTSRTQNTTPTAIHPLRSVTITWLHNLHQTPRKGYEITTMPSHSRWSRTASTRRRRRRVDDASAAAASAVAPVSLTDAMRAARTTAGSATLHPLLTEPPAACTAALEGVSLGEVLEQRSGLPRLSAVLHGGTPEPLRVCYLGGSVTEQRNGYRPRVTRWLEAAGAKSRVRVEEVPAFCGSAWACDRSRCLFSSCS